MRGKLWGDKRGISVMQDAVLFCVMVSLSGAILMPAFTSNTIQKTYIEKENEEKADEVLNQLMVCKADEFEHLNGETILNGLGVNTNQGLLKPVIDNLLEREQLHRTYADLCTECMACQFEFSGSQINILTRNFTEMMKIKLEEFLDKQLGDGYGYNFTIVWNPIVGFDFGGKILVGQTIPSNANVYTASTYVMMPPSLFATGIGSFLENIRNYVLNNPSIGNDFTSVKDGVISQEEFKHDLTVFLVDLINKTVWGGFEDGTNSMINIALDYIFSSIQNAVEKAFDDAINMTASIIIGAGGENFSEVFNQFINTSLHRLFPSIIGTSPLSGAINEIKQYIRYQVKNFINETMGERINAMVENVVDNIGKITDIGTEILNWIFQQLDFCRARMVLSIWGA